MKLSWNEIAGGLMVGIACIAYAMLAHYASANGNIGNWVILVAVTPILIVAAGLAKGQRYGSVIWLLLLTSCAALARAWPKLENPVAWLFFLQHVGINFVLGAAFITTLRAQRQPLCTTMAKMVHKEMTPTLMWYTRQLTYAWAIFFFAITATSVLLFFLTPIAAWSIFANFLMLPLIVAMFIADTLARKKTLPPEDRAGIRSTLHALRANFRT